MFPDTQLLATGHQAPVLSLAVPALMVLPVNEFPSCVFQDGGGVGWLWEWLRTLLCGVVGEYWSFCRAVFPFTPEMDAGTLGSQ